MLSKFIAKLTEQYHIWRRRQDYQRSVLRMRDCRHPKTVYIDVGVPARKCLYCWALYCYGGPHPKQWLPNSTRPPA